MSQKTGQNNNTGCVVIGGIVLILFAIVKCSPSTQDSPKVAAEQFTQNLTSAISAQETNAPEPLNFASVKLGMSHLKKTFGAEGFSGAMVYSQNCYDSLSKEFSWARVDICGAFDMLTVRSIAQADTDALINEAAYFQSEVAAGRYLAAVTGAGEEAANADERLERVVERVKSGTPVGQALKVKMDDPVEQPVLDSIDAPEVENTLEI